MKLARNTQYFPMGFFYRVLFIIAGIFSMIGCGSGVQHKFDGHQAAADIEASLNRSVLNSDGKINRNVLLYLNAPTVNFTYTGAAGIGRVDTNEPMKADRQFIIASAAKTMTAVIIYQLAEEGRFGNKGIDTRLAELDIFPQDVLADLHRIDGISYADEITIRHLLNHTAGLRDVYFDGLDNSVSLMPGTAEGAAPGSLVGKMAFDEQLGLAPLVNCTLDGVPAGCNPNEYLFRRQWLPWDFAAWQANPQDKMAGLLNFYLAGMNEHALWRPGKGFHYSDTDYILLGLVIEKLTDNSLHHELRARIFDPLKMDNTYLIGANDPPAENYEKQLAEVWAWSEPAISGGVNFSFDWGGGGIVSTLEDLNTFTRALVAGELFQRANTLDEMLSVPVGIQGINYASGLIVFPTENGQVLYMMGSNGTWVEYYPPLDLVMIGSTDDFSDMPRQFRLHIEIFQILARHGLSTPMAKVSSVPMLLVMFCLVLLLALPLLYLIGVLLRNRKLGAATPSINWARWLTAATFLVNLLMTALIGATFGENMFQMLFGFSSQVRLLCIVTAILIGICALGMAVVAAGLWRRGEGKFIERGIFTAIVIIALIYSISLSSLGI